MNITKDQLEDPAFQETTRITRSRRRVLIVTACFLYVLALLEAYSGKSKLTAILVALGGLLCSLAVIIVDAATALRNDHKVLYDLLKAQKKQEEK